MYKTLKCILLLYRATKVHVAGNIHESNNILRQIIELQRSNRRWLFVYTMLSRRLIENKQVSEAERLLQEALNVNPYSHKLNYEMARLLHIRGYAANEIAPYALQYILARSVDTRKNKLIKNIVNIIVGPKKHLF